MPGVSEEQEQGGREEKVECSEMRPDKEWGAD